MISPNSIVGQMRLMTGDFSTDASDPWLPDSVYTCLLYTSDAADE